MSKKPYRGMLKENRKSIFKLDPTLSRWILRRPAASSLLNIFGHAVNEDFNGVLFRDEDEARAAQRRQDQDPWLLESFGQPDGCQLAPYVILQAELDAKDQRGNLIIPLIEWPYLVLFRKAQALQFASQEIPVSPTRRELFHFIRDKSAAAATVSRDLGSLQTQVIEMQKMIEQLSAAQAPPSQVAVAPQPVPLVPPPVASAPAPVAVPAVAPAPPVVPPSPSVAPIV